MNVRLPDQVRQPLLVVVDAHYRMPPEAAMLHMPGGAVIVAGAALETEEARARTEALRRAGADILTLPDRVDSSRVDLRALLIELAAREVNDVHLEAGARLSGAFLNAGLVDELIVYQAPCLFGEGAGPAAVEPPASPGLAHRWHVVSLETIGKDIRIICRRN